MSNLPVRQSDDLIDRFEAELIKRGAEYAGPGETLTMCPVTHRFTPGLYIREIFMPAGTVLTSKIHKTEHPFAVLCGEVEVFTDGGIELIVAPHMGITKPGTRRVLRIIKDTVWVTFHATQKTDPAEIEEDIIEIRTNPYLTPELEARI